MAKKPTSKPGEKLISANKTARRNYNIEKKIEVGIELKGSEVKSCRNGKVQLVDSFAVVENGQLMMYKAHIAEYPQGGPYFNHEPQRKRRLLAHKKEIRKLQAMIDQKGYSLVPLRFYFKSGMVKVELGLGKGRKSHDKRSVIKDREVSRQLDREMKRSKR